MPIRIVHRYTRDDLRAHPDQLFAYGDNCERWGRGGQAAACRYEPNAVGIATLKAPGVFWSDADFAANSSVIDADMEPLFEALNAGKTVVWPEDGVGTGLADLANRAPKTFAHLQQRVAQLKALGGL